MDETPLGLRVNRRCPSKETTVCRCAGTANGRPARPLHRSLTLVG